MTRPWQCAAVAAGIVVGGGLAVAADPTGTKGESEVTRSGADAATGTARDTGAADCSHQVTGTVKKSDRTSGSVLIDLAGGEDLTLHLTPAEASQFQTGDQVVVSLGVRESGARGGR